MSQNQIILKKQFDSIQELDNPKAKKKHYTKTYYYQNKERYKKYYQDNKEQRKEYAKNYKNQKQKKIFNNNCLTVEYGNFIINFDSDYEEDDEEIIQSKNLALEPGKLSFLQFFQQQQVQEPEPVEPEVFEEPLEVLPKKWKFLKPPKL